MERPLKILLLEDSRIDAEIVTRLLLKEKMNCEFHLVMNKKNFILALDDFFPDVILSDNSLPGFNATDALKITRERYLHIPFILVTGTVSEEYAANIIKEGADDYILKDRMARLPAAIDAALNQRKIEKEIADYRYALDQSAIVAITDQKGTILYANENFCKISKYSQQELVGQDHRIINSGHHPASFIKNLWTTIANGKIWRSEFRNKAKDGSFYWVDTTIVPFLNKDGKPYQYLSIRKDITERKKAEEQLIEREEQLELFIEHSPASLAMFDTDMRYIAVSRRWINDYKLDGRELIGKMHYDIFPGIPQRWKDIHRQCLEGAIVKNEEDSFTLEDGSTNWLHWEIRPWHKASGEIGGIIIFTEDITERKMANEQLRKSEEKYRTIFLKSPLPKWVFDQETLQFLDVNEAAIAHYGYSREEFLSMTIRDIRPKEDVVLLLAEIVKINESAASRFGTWRHLKKNGEQIIVETTAHTIEYNERKARMVVSNDITEKIAFEQQKEFDSNNLKALINNTKDLMWSVDRDLKLITFNDSFNDVITYMSGQPLVKGGDILSAQFTGDQLERYKVFYERALQGESFTFIDHFEGPVDVWAEISFYPIRKGDEVIGTACFSRDITERKKAEEVIRLSEMALKEAQAIAHISNWGIDLAKNAHTWSDEFYRIYGLNKEEVVPSAELFLSLMHPDDAGFAANKVQEAFLSFQDSSFNFRFIRKDGVLRHGYTEWRFEFDEKGNPLKLFGILQDITERKEAEENLKLLEQQILEQKIEEQKQIARAIITGQEKERNHIGQELHDNINQILAGTKMFLGIAAKKSDEVREIIKYPMELIDSSIEEIRLLCRKLVTPLKNIDLKDLVGNLMGKIEQGETTKTAFTYSVPNELLSDDLKLNIYRIIQEQVNNILKYAQAKNVSIAIEAKDEAITITVTDDGNGFNVESAREGIGISNMINRAETFNGRVEIISSPGKGCTITVAIPC